MKISDYIRALGLRYTISLVDAGANPSVVHIQLVDLGGEPVARPHYVRVRLSTAAQYAPTGILDSILDTSGAAEVISTGNDAVFLSDGAGRVTVAIEHADDPALVLRVGPAPVSALAADYSATLSFSGTGPGGPGGT